MRFNRKLYRASESPINYVNQGRVMIIGDYDHVLKDYLKRDFAIDFKVNHVQALGYPHVWNEQKAIPENTKAVDPRVGFGTKEAPSYRPTTLNDNYNRDNWKQAFARCYITGIRYDFFDKKLEETYGVMEDLIAKDYNDMFVDFSRKTANDFWNGTGTLDGTTENDLVYCGVLSQITDKTAIVSGANIADSLTTKITSLMTRLDYTNYPDVICMNPATYDIIMKQEQNRDIYSKPVDMEIIPGISVPAFYTPMGKLPIVLTPFIKPVTDGGKTTHSIVALNTSMIDKLYMFNDGPQTYEIANPDNPLANDRLLTDKFVMDFANYIVHGAHTGAHFIMTYEVTA